MGATPFQLEAWTEYGIGLLVLFARIIYRSITLGKHWEGDDYFAVVSVFFWTAELCMLELIGQNGAITGLTQEVAEALSEEQRQGIVFGSKCLLAGWCLYVTLIWCLKACMLFLLGRITTNLNQQRFVQLTAWTCGAAYVATIIVILARCAPIHKTWQILPIPSDACSKNIPNYYALVVTNLTTDIMIVSIPIPLLWQVQMPPLRKLMCDLWLCTGVFIVVATLLRCILCLRQADDINVGTIWSIRETFVAIIAVNLPVLGPWITKTVSAVRSKGSQGHESGMNPNKSDHLVTIGKQSNRLERLNKDGRGWTNIDTESEERIIPERS
ncbi:uncharacterized protein F5Z01DRAFT_675996 [Emericellopsis atlantica]|uniref:Rhodopsin domain-containing protein n=1 Tax=Emericellopsis atlantica TaxID=2614577 RepID=A0A9P7ZIQ2_9HYPO|nr:uncharacterized protein F5Z01DRAFT_675996 [Emericellopsis atlantica]KAG9252517.1 hypothetical protein F5Z01DRAFT_675996 [Emericellopsis atlantica]